MEKIKGRCVWHTAVISAYERNIIPQQPVGPLLHICPMAMWLIILGIPIQDAPRRQETKQEPLFPSSIAPPPLPALVFHFALL